jgi:hypothetical protein
MVITKVTRDSLLKLAKEKKIYLEGNILKIITPSEDDEFNEYIKLCKEKDTSSRRKRLEVTKQVQSQNNQLELAAKKNADLMNELTIALEETKISEQKASDAKLEAEILRDNALEDLDSLQKRTQFELMGKIIKVALYVIIGVGLLTTMLFAYTLIFDKDSVIVETTWSNLFGILLTNSFSIVGTIMGVKYASGKE